MMMTRSGPQAPKRRPPLPLPTICVVALHVAESMFLPCVCVRTGDAQNGPAWYCRLRSSQHGSSGAPAWMRYASDARYTPVCLSQSKALGERGIACRTTRSDRGWQTTPGQRGDRL